MESEAVPKRTRRAPADVAGFQELRSRIVERYPQLSQQQQQIATFALAYPEMMALETAEQLGRRLAVQPSALVRFAHALDYGGFREMKERFRANLVFTYGTAHARTETPSPQAAASATHSSHPSFAHDFISRGIEELDQLQRRLDSRAFDAAVNLLRQADAVYVTAQHLAYPFAALFGWTLIQSGRHCHVLDNTAGFALPQARLLSRGELLVAISIAPYQASVVQAAQAHAEHGGKVLAITDTALSPLAPHAAVLLELPPPATPVPPLLTGLTCIVQALVQALDSEPVGPP